MSALGRQNPTATSDSQSNRDNINLGGPSSGRRGQFGSNNGINNGAASSIEHAPMNGFNLGGATSVNSVQNGLATMSSIKNSNRKITLGSRG